MGKKIEIPEDEFKKIVLILKCSKRYVNLPPSNLFLGNLWRVSSKLADKLHCEECNKQQKKGE